jgi:hypothetical protein
VTVLTLSPVLACDCCGRLGAVRRRMNTAFPDDANNFCIQCDACFELTEQFWDDMWEEHWTNVRTYF